jgi:hypothetical protein
LGVLLRHIACSDGLLVDPKKLIAITIMPILINVIKILKNWSNWFLWMLFPTLCQQSGTYVQIIKER